MEKVTSGPKATGLLKDEGWGTGTAGVPANPNGNGNGNLTGSGATNTDERLLLMEFYGPENLINTLELPVNPAARPTYPLGSSGRRSRHTRVKFHAARSYWSTKAEIVLSRMSNCLRSGVGMASGSKVSASPWRKSLA
jgi:hypothetical protein